MGELLIKGIFVNASPPSWSQWLAYVVAAAGAFLIMAAVVWTAYDYTRPAPVGAARVEERKKALAEMRAYDAETLNHYGWADQAKGLVRLPIARAMELTVQAYQDPAAARTNLVARADRAAAPPPKAPEKPNPYE
jgi:hypothetical protein